MMKINKIFIISFTVGFFLIATSSATLNRSSDRKRNDRNEIIHNRSKRWVLNTPQCLFDTECKDSERCMNNQCTHVCKPDPCGINAWCRGAEDHRPLCTCYLGLTGDPHVQCFKKSCMTNDDCAESDKCERNSCTAVCPHNLCGSNRTCNAENHESVCDCAEGFTGDPKIQCLLRSCKTDKDCGDSDKCENKRCTAACSIEDYGEDELCHVENHRPVYTCKNGFTGDPESGCVKICSTSNECADTEKCERNSCVEVCDDPYLCDEGAWCHVEDHVHVCTDTEVSYNPPRIEYTKTNCTTTEDCDTFEQCKNNECIDVCHPNPCGSQALCARDNHRAVCFCVNGYIGDPHTECVMAQCINNGHCQYYEKCRNNFCINFCGPNPCGRRATCFVEDNRPVCLCKDGSVEPDTGCKIKSRRKSKIGHKKKRKTEQKMELSVIGIGELS